MIFFPYQDIILISFFVIALLCQVCIDASVTIISGLEDFILYIPILGAIKACIYTIIIMVYGLFFIDEYLQLGTALAIWSMFFLVSTMFLFALNAVARCFFDFKGWCV